MPWYRGPGFWTGPFVIAVALVVAGGLGYSWYVFGGFPRDYDRYGTIDVPGQLAVRLPEGDIRIYFETEADVASTGSQLRDAPEGLAVRVSRPKGGRELEVEDIPGSLFSSIRGDRGHEPFGKVDVPEAGRYLIQTTDRASGGFEASRRGGAGDRRGPEIAVGATPWNPLDSKEAGAILCGVAVLLAFVVLFLPVRLLVMRDAHT